MTQFYLADTQIVIWSIISPSKIAPTVQVILQNNPIVVSEVNLLEIAIKQKIGRLPEFSLSVDDLVTQLLADGFQLLPIESTSLRTNKYRCLMSTVILLIDYSWQRHCPKK